MELETVVLEDTEVMDLGDAQQAYDAYPQAKESFLARRAEYSALVADLKLKDHVAISKKEIEKADNVYEELKRLQQECLDMKSILWGDNNYLSFHGRPYIELFHYQYHSAC